MIELGNKVSDKQRSCKRIAMISAVRLREETSLSLRAGILLDVLPTCALHPIRFVLVCYMFPSGAAVIGLLRDRSSCCACLRSWKLQ